MTANTIVIKKYSHNNEMSLVSIAVIFILVLCFIYIIESNSFMSQNRDVQQLNKKIAVFGEDISQLEVEAAKLRLSQNIEESAVAKRMVLSDKVHYLNLSDGAVAMTR